jgi:hypothetical protein
LKESGESTTRVSGPTEPEKDVFEVNLLVLVLDSDPTTGYLLEG